MLNSTVTVAFSSPSSRHVPLLAAAWPRNDIHLGPGDRGSAPYAHMTHLITHAYVPDGFCYGSSTTASGFHLFFFVITADQAYCIDLVVAVYVSQSTRHCRLGTTDLCTTYNGFDVCVFVATAFVRDRVAPRFAPSACWWFISLQFFAIGATYPFTVPSCHSAVPPSGLSTNHIASTAAPTP
jgi:hypothetical protein